MCEEFENEKKKEQHFLTFRSVELNPRFSVIFPPMIWIFMESEEPEIKSKQASFRDRTLKYMPKLIWTCCFSTFEIFNKQPLWILIQGWEQGQESHYIQPSNLSSALESIVNRKVKKWKIFPQFYEGCEDEISVLLQV